MSRRLLERAAGYVVYGSDGRRIGKLIELVTDGEGTDSVAIRCDRVFLWRRRTVPAAAVARVDPEERTVRVLLDEAGIERAHELQAGEIGEGWVADRIARYAGAVGAEADAPAFAADIRAAPPRPEGSEALAGDAADEAAPGQHVLFAPTSAGYVLIERNGAPPPCPETIELSDPAGSFVVVKLAQSPLPKTSGPVPTPIDSIRRATVGARLPRRRVLLPRGRRVAKCIPVGGRSRSRLCWSHGWVLVYEGGLGSDTRARACS